MKAFIAYRHTGEEEATLSALLGAVRDALVAVGVEVYCTFFEESEFQDKQMSPREIMDHAFKIIEGSDLLFIVQASQEKSEGMLMEVGFARAKGIKVIVATKSGIDNSYLPSMGDVNFAWTDYEELALKITQLDLN